MITAKPKSSGYAYAWTGRLFRPRVIESCFVSDVVVRINGINEKRSDESEKG
jgi:hypothetical protein